MIKLKAAWISFSLIVASGCAKKNKNDLFVYTSTYKEVVALYAPYIKQKFPEINIQWFQAGSEVITTKIQAEIAGGQIKADLLMTSDLFLAQDLASKGYLAKLNDSALARLDSAYIGPNRDYVVSRFPVMVIAYNKTKITEVPKSFADLAKSIYKDKITMPSPLESGTAMTSVMFLRNAHGEGYFKKLRENNVLAAGGNGSAMARILSGEKPVGIVLMENVLQAKEKGSTDVEFVIPTEGAIPIPSPLAVFKNSKNVEAAKKLADWFISDEAQAILLKGWVYSPFPQIAAPANAPAWKDFKKQEWNIAIFEKWGTEKQSAKDYFQKTVLQ